MPLYTIITSFDVSVGEPFLVVPYFFFTVVRFFVLHSAREEE